MAERDAIEAVPILHALAPQSARPAFVSVAVPLDTLSPTSCLTLELRSGRRLRFGDSMPIEHVAELVHVLETRALEAHAQQATEVRP